MLTVCVIMSLSIYLYHKRIHKNSMLWVARWIWSCLSFKILEITECSLMIYIVPRQRRHCDTVRIHVEIIRKRCEEFHSKTLDIQIQHKIKPLPEVYHPVCEKSTGSTFFSFFLLLSFFSGNVFLSHFGTKLFMFSSWLNTVIIKNMECVIPHN